MFTGNYIMVEGLIIRESRTWNIQLLHELFEAKDVELIFAMPLSRKVVLDRLIWVETLLSNFYCKIILLCCKEGFWKGGCFFGISLFHLETDMVSQGTTYY